MKILLEFGGISHLHGSAVGKGGENGELAPDAGRGFREDDDPIRHADGFGDIVGDQKRGFSFFTQDLPDVITDGKSGLIIQCAERFIEKQKCRFQGKSTDQCGPLSHPAGKLGRVGKTEVPETILL